MGVVLTACLLLPPVPGPIVRPFAPTGTYAGHWGVDFAGAPFDEVGSPLGGVVVFAGTVAGMRSVSVVGAGGTKVSVSYLAAIDVHVGDRVSAGEVIGRVGFPHGRPGVHLSVRIGGAYRDPAPMLQCDRRGSLRLLPPEVRTS